MELYESFYNEPIYKYLNNCLHKTYDSESELKMLQSIRDYVDSRIDECAIASEEEIRNGYTDEFGVLYTYDGVKLIKGHEELTNYVIRTGTKIICDNAFKDCRQLNAISIPDTVEIIGHGSFCRCRRLKSIQLPYSVKKIKGQCFWYCQDLTRAIMPKIDYVSEELFVGCKLEEFEIPESVTTLEKSCFASCDFKDIIIPKYVKTIEKMAFFNCKKLETIQIESSILEKIDEDAFKQCESIKRIYVPNGKKDYFTHLFPEQFADIIIEENKIDNGKKKSIIEEIEFPLKYTLAKEPIGTIISFLDFKKIYSNWEIWAAGDSKEGIIYYGIFSDDNKNIVITKVSNKVSQYSDQAMKYAQNNLVIRVINTQRYLLCEKWE